MRNLNVERTVAETFYRRLRVVTKQEGRKSSGGTCGWDSYRIVPGCDICAPLVRIMRCAFHVKLEDKTIPLNGTTAPPRQPEGQSRAMVDGHTDSPRGEHPDCSTSTLTSSSFQLSRFPLTVLLRGLYTALKIQPDDSFSVRDMIGRHAQFALRSPTVYEA